MGCLVFQLISPSDHLDQLDWQKRYCVLDKDERKLYFFNDTEVRSVCVCEGGGVGGVCVWVWVCACVSLCDTGVIVHYSLCMGSGVSTTHLSEVNKVCLWQVPSWMNRCPG